MRPTKQRALIALRSFTSVAAAARSIGCTANTLLRVSIDYPDVAKAYLECASGLVAKRKREEVRRQRRQIDSQKPRVSERIAERRMRGLFYLTGRDPAAAAAALHKRLNRERRQERAYELETAIDTVNELIAHRPSAPPDHETLELWDRWCARCKSHRVDDPCELCGMHTIVVKA